ncbi:MAG: C10 family peptidase, partial [bacterium]
MAALLLTSWAAVAEPTTAADARQAVRRWLRADPRPLGAPLGRAVARVETYRDEKGGPLYYVVTLRPAGFVVVSGDDLVEPFIAFAAQGRYEASSDNPLGALVTRDLPRRIRQARGIDAGLADGATVPAPAQRARRKWRLRPPPRNDGGEIDLPSVSDPRVSPLLGSRWSQGSVGGRYCYNYYTPNHYVCGCVATAMAQLMRFHRYPTGPVGTAEYTIYVDGEPESRRLRGGDGSGGAYCWADMPLVPSSSSTDAQRRAIGALCHDAGLSVNMHYSRSGSGAYHLGGSSLATTFGYSSAIEASSSTDLGQALIHMANTNLDSGRPVLLGIFGAGGHAIVCDGYGYNLATLYHHLNLGWAGAYDAWYNLPNVGTGYDFDTVLRCVYNVYRAGSGEIISGRVTDEDGDPVPAALVRAVRSGGGTYTATTNSRGIYAIAKMPSASTYTVSCYKPGHTFEDQVVQVGTSRSSRSTTGNVWGVDFGGPPPVRIATTSLPRGAEGAP